MNWKIIINAFFIAMILLCACSPTTSDISDFKEEELESGSYTPIEPTKKTDIDNLNPQDLLDLTEENLVGLWQKSSFLAAGWHDRYFLYDDMTFRFEYNQMDLDKKVHALVGKWNLDNNTLVLEIDEKILIFYEPLADDDPRDPATVFRDESFKMIQLNEPEIVELVLGEMTVDESGRIHRKTMLIGDEQYWKFNDTAEEYEK